MGIIGNQMYTLSQTHTFSAFSFTNIKIQISTSHQTHDFSAYFFYKIIGNQICTSL